MLTALSFVLERFLPIVNTDAIRISLGNIPIIITSIFFGPFFGAVCGLLSDIIGCFVSGYPPFPVLMLAPLTVGVLPGISAKLFKNRVKNGISNIFVLSGTMAVTNIIASLLVTTAGLNMLYGTPVAALLWQRVPAFAISTLIEIIVLKLLLKNGVLYRLFGTQK